MAMHPQTAALNPAALIASQQRGSKFIPQAGTTDKPSYLVVQFPGESMRCPVQKVVDEDTVIIRIDSPPISRVHSFRFDEIVGVRRRSTAGRQDVWEAQTERDFLAEQKRRHTTALERKPKPAPQPQTPVKQAKPEVPVAKPAVPAPKKAAAKKPTPAKRKKAAAKAFLDAAASKPTPKRKAAR